MCGRTVLLALFLCFYVVSAGDLYDILGVSKTSTTSEIKRAFKRLARQYHPDVAKDEEKEDVREKFRVISDAYEVLVDAKRRKEYDSNGRIAPGDDRNFLRHNLFSTNFDGDVVAGDDVESLRQGNNNRTTFVFFWSSNFPDCIEAGLAFKTLAAKVKTSSIRICSLRCDDYVPLCNSFAFGRLPQAVLFPKKSVKLERFAARYDVQTLTEFVTRFISKGVVVSTSPSHLLDVCPDPSASIGGFASAFLSKNARKCYKGEVKTDFVALEHTACFDCGTELTLAMETVRMVLPMFYPRRLDCAEHTHFCSQLVRKVPERAWTVVSTQLVCWYAMKRAFDFVEEHCEVVEADTFKGRFTSSDFLDFAIGSHVVVQVFDESLRTRMVKSNDSFSVLFYDSTDKSTLEIIPLWKALALYVGQKKPTGRKGFTVTVANADCSLVQCHDILGGNHLPVVGVYGFGVQAKSQQPTFLSKVNAPKDMVKAILREAEPLQLHILGPQSYQTKLKSGFEKGKSWFVLFNAGSWCPPCNQVRLPWKEMARIIQEKTKKISVGQVECDTHPKLCMSLQIKSYPTMMFFTSEKRIEYQEERNTASMTDWALDMLGNRLIKMGPPELNRKLQEGQTVLVSFSAGKWCPPCTQLEPVFKKAANLLVGMEVTAINCDEMGPFCHTFGIDGYPTIILFKQQQRHVFNGERSVDGVVNWAKKFL